MRGPTLARLAMALVLLSIGNTPALRVIALQDDESLLSIGNTPDSRVMTLLGILLLYELSLSI